MPCRGGKSYGNGRTTSVDPGSIYKKAAHKGTPPRGQRHLLGLTPKKVPGGRTFAQGVGVSGGNFRGGLGGACPSWGLG